MVRISACKSTLVSEKAYLFNFPVVLLILRMNCTFYPSIKVTAFLNDFFALYVSLISLSMNLI